MPADDGSSRRRISEAGRAQPVLRSPRIRQTRPAAESAKRDDGASWQRAPTIVGVQEIPTHFRDLTLDAFVDRLASADPVPGGGSASAVAASLAAGLVAMVATLSEGRPRYAVHAATHARTKAAGLELADRLLRIADEDAAAYGAFSAALKLPRETETEQATRTAAMRDAARVAAEVPLRCVEACLEVITAAELLAARCNVNASSDLHVAALLSEAAAKGAAANVRVNLPSVGDSAWAAAIEQRLEELLRGIAGLCASTHKVVASGESRPPVASLA
ncbi:MAG: methenyltetrahydrofolate cyclohydrolase [Chloroflexi bacterium]|nr:methenyltetrahydrofolate cyclohydrolase [Chloroflexota bacterium]